jgi:hypothetical protein
MNTAMAATVTQREILQSGCNGKWGMTELHSFIVEFTGESVNGAGLREIAISIVSSLWLENRRPA